MKWLNYRSCDAIDHWHFEYLLLRCVTVAVPSCCCFQLHSIIGYLLIHFDSFRFDFHFFFSLSASTAVDIAMKNNIHRPFYSNIIIFFIINTDWPYVNFFHRCFFSRLTISKENIYCFYLRIKSLCVSFSARATTSLAGEKIGNICQSRNATNGKNGRINAFTVNY